MPVRAAGVPTVLLGLVLTRMLPEKPEDAAWLTPEEAARCALFNRVSVATAGGGPPSHEAPAHGRCLSLLRRRVTANVRGAKGGGAHAHAQPHSLRSALSAVRAAASNWRVWYLGFIHFAGMSSVYAVLFWSPLLIRRVVFGGGRGSGGGGEGARRGQLTAG